MEIILKIKILIFFIFIIGFSRLIFKFNQIPEVISKINTKNNTKKEIKSYDTDTSHLKIFNSIINNLTCDLYSEKTEPSKLKIKRYSNNLLTNVKIKDEFIFFDNDIKVKIEENPSSFKKSIANEMIKNNFKGSSFLNPNLFFENNKYSNLILDFATTNGIKIEKLNNIKKLLENEGLYFKNTCEDSERKDYLFRFTNINNDERIFHSLDIFIRKSAPEILEAYKKLSEGTETHILIDIEYVGKLELINLSCIEENTTLEYYIKEWI